MSVPTDGPRGAVPPTSQASPIGLVRGVDPRAWRHSYGAGEAPEGVEIEGELGALLSAPAPGFEPAWIADDGRLVTEQYEAIARRPGPWQAIRWCSTPLRWRDAGPLRTRMRAALGRTRRYLRGFSRRRRRAPERSGDPIGCIATTLRGGSRELFSSVHPITGDQLLSTRRGDADAQGYVGQTSLGYLLADAPVTGTLALARRFLPSGARPGDLVATPHGGLLRPPPRGKRPVPRDALRVNGFAVLENEPVARVEVLVDGRNVGRARVGIQRPRNLRIPDVPEAPVCGFDLRISPSAVPPGAREVSVEVVVTGIDGTDFLLAPEPAVRLDPPITHRSASRSSTNGSVSAVRRARGAEGTRLLAFAHNLEPGGAQRTLFEQLVRLSSREVSSVVVSPQAGPWEQRLKDAEISVHITDPYPFTDSARYEKQKASLREWIGDQAFDGVFANTLGCFMGVDLARELGLPSVWMIHESYELPVWWNMVQGKQPRPELRDRCMQALAHTDALMFPAAATRRLFEPYARTEEIAVAPCGVEFEEIDRYHAAADVAQLRRESNLPPEAEVLLCLGIVEPRKGQTVLARAFSLIAERHPEAHLVFVGGTDSRYAKGLQRYIEKAGLSERCRLVPATMEPFRWHALADIFVLPSDIESAPVVLAEAMAFETPAVAANVFGIPEMITDGRDGFLCEPNDVADLAATLDRLLSLDPEERRRAAVAGSRRAREHHDPSRFQHDFEALLGRLLDGQALQPVSAEER